ncbi:MAG: hypothetical protein HY614_02145 [Candidatus Rokubacteria bacterium]|nr:hypothetical protein [Candidatus Rokubacteria bacterium]
MSRGSCWGIFREQTHSPGRESDDAEILRLTGKCLEGKGFQVVLKSPEELGEPVDGRPRSVFLMCESLGALSRLRGWETGGVRQVNSPAAVLNTYRERMIVQFQEANVPFIESRIVATAEPCGETPLPVWVKRADVHNTQAGDVVFASTGVALQEALRGLAERDIPRAVIQEHLEGDLIKFYGIGGGRDGGPAWFRWFYHADQKIAGHPFDPRGLPRLVRRAAAALGLEVYGGDALVMATGDIVLLDLNAWPSFALYRDEAAERIASYLALRFGGGRR